MNVGEQLPEIELRTAEGEAVPLSRYVDRPTVVQLLRYYGWMPCRDMLSQLREAHPDIVAMGAGAVAVATGADYQARALMSEGLPFPALLDPDKNLYHALGIERIPWDQWVRLSTWKRYLRSLRRARQGRLTGDILQAPGVVVLDAERVIRYLHRGTTLGDYPPLPEVLDALRTVAKT